MQRDVDATRDMNHWEQLTEQRKGCLFLIRSLGGGLGVPVAVGALRSVLVGARAGRVGGLRVARMVAWFAVSPPSLRAVVGRRSSFFQV